MNHRIVKLPLIFAAAVLLASCATSRYPRGPSAPPPGTKDNKPSLWTDDHSKVEQFRRHYARTVTVETALRRSQSYMPYIIPEFRRRRLPLQLAYLPMLESNFDPRADSGHAKGLWQFVPGTAQELGLRIGVSGDDRLNVRKSSQAAAEYLDRLGERYNYNWALALAAYNCGPGCVDDAVKRERSWDFWELDLRRETADYVPRFIAMLRVAQDQYPELIVAELQSPDNRKRLSLDESGDPSADPEETEDSAVALIESDEPVLSIADAEPAFPN